jgi:glucose/arabinose dehydrogenase
VALPDVTLVVAFPQLPAGSFGTRPLFFTEVPDGSRRAVVVEQGGRVFVFRLDAQSAGVATFLDISKKVSTSGNEEGLLGLAFDPSFSSTGHFYVYYSAANPRRSVISRLTVPPASNAADPASEHVVLEVAQPYANHNGGMLAFGPDGYLYVGLGDGGSSGDPMGHGQNLATLLGSILRIDVHRPVPGGTYSAPADNPFADRPESQARHEIWAYGLRNPWRFSFDRVTGELWAGDVGQNSWEEIDLITKGGNYGWNLMEGLHCFRQSTCNQSGLLLPVAEYATGQFGCAVTGGYVYRGGRYPELKGVYLYADYCSGLIWGLRHRDGALVAGPRVVAQTGRLISSFGEDSAGELYVTVFGSPGSPATVLRVSPR